MTSRQYYERIYLNSSLGKFVVPELGIGACAVAV